MRRAGRAPLSADLPAQQTEESRQAESTGARVGGAVGLAAGVAAAPVAGPAMAIAITIGAVLRGREIGGVLQHVGAGRSVTYPKQVVLQVQHPTPR